MIDSVSSAPHYRAHLLPLFDALPLASRGDRVDLDAAGRSRRVDPTHAVVVASYRDMGRAYALGYRRIALAAHGIGQSYVGLRHGSHPGGPGRDVVGLFLSPNETAADLDRVAYPAARVEVIGDPGLDALPRGPGDGSVALSWHWSWSRYPEMRSALPHYRSALPALASRFRLIGHAHPRMRETLRPVYRRLGIEFVESFDEVCRRASVYVADNSSTIFEFASTGRPVVLLNAPSYRREVESGLRFWAAAGVGRQVDDPADLAEVIACALSEPQPSTVAEALRLAYSESTGAARRGAAVLCDWMA